MAKKLLIDLFEQMSIEDEGEEFVIEVGDVRCPETGELYTGTFIIKDLEVVDEDDERV